MARERSDIIVIGAGASGAIASKHLAEAGFKVTCLEQGPHVEPEEYYGDRLEWEFMAHRRWHPNPNVRQLPADYPVNAEESDVNPLMYNAVGGSTILYAAQWQRGTPSDFRVRTLDGVADDWPISYAELEPFYDFADIEMGVSGLAGDPAYPPMTAPPLPPFPLGKVGRKAAEGLNKLGWHWWPGPQAIPSKPYREQSQCARRGTCLHGCPESAKGSTNITHWPDALKLGARLITGARVRKVTMDENGLAAGAIYQDAEGRETELEADAVIVCANGVGTPRLLLLSENSRYPNGLANSSGLVGRNLMMHPWASVIGYFEEDLESWVGPAGQLIHCMEFYETDASRGFVRGGKWSAMPTGGPLGMRAAYAGRPLDEAWGPAFHKEVRKRLGRSFEWGIVAEDLPDPDNRVMLDPALTDSNGIPAPKVVYTNSENTEKLLAFHVARAKEALEASGAHDITASQLMRDCGWHLLGTCRMGDDPERSVVDSWGRSHDIPNLYIFDGSVFVTSTGVNPTGTIAAIVLRCVNHMIENRHTLKERP